MAVVSREAPVAVVAREGTVALTLISVSLAADEIALTVPITVPML